MRVAILRPYEPPFDPVDLCVVIDVVRATTTAAVLCQRLGELRVVRALGDLDRLPATPAGHALFSELAAPAIDIPHFDNSPVVARTVELGGRMPVLVTTNGTIAVELASQFATEIVLGSFVNFSTVIDHVRGSGAERVAVLPAGHIQRADRTIEDDGCATAIADRLGGNVAQLDEIIASCRADPRLVRRATQIAADLDVCFDIDAIPVIPRVAATRGEPWFVVTRA